MLRLKNSSCDVLVEVIDFLLEEILSAGEALFLPHLMNQLRKSYPTISFRFVSPGKEAEHKKCAVDRLYISLRSNSLTPYIINNQYDRETMTINMKVDQGLSRLWSAGAVCGTGSAAKRRR